jgi:hypothetical protein
LIIFFIAAGATVTFLLRSPAAFETDETIQKYVKEGKARLVKGDGLVKNEVKHGWDEAHEVGPVDLLIFTVGTCPRVSRGDRTISNNFLQVALLPFIL